MAVTKSPPGPHPLGYRWLKGLLVVGLAALTTLTALPHYLNGQWPWTRPPEVVQIDQLRRLKQTGLEIPGWDQSQQQVLQVNRHDWNFSQYVATADAAPEAVSQFGLLLRPQPWHRDQPTVEWVDLRGAQGWQHNQRQTIRFRSPSPSGGDVSVQAQYYRAWNQQQTFAVLQWYAWSTGGSDAPGHWFWADQLSQWRQRQRMPWVAVSLLIPIEPLGQVQPYQERAIALGSQIQAVLMAGTLAAETAP